MKTILHSRPWLTDADLEALREVMSSGMLAQGERTAEFESALSDWCGAGGGVAVGSGSAAIVLALEALGVSSGHEVIVPTYICPKVVEAVATVGATPVFCDIGPRWKLTADCVAPVVTRATRALIVPHLYGIYADVAALRPLGIPIIEDCAQALDYRHRRKIAGDAAIFSFHPTKLITTGEGGMAVSADDGLVARMRALRDGSGSYRNARLFSPLPDLAAALGLSQLNRFHAALDRRISLAAAYRAALEPLVPECFQDYPVRNNVFFRFPIVLPGGIQRFRPLFAALGIRVSNGVDALVHRSFGHSDAGFEKSVQLFDSTISLPLYPALTDEEHRRCIDGTVEILAACPDVVTRGAASPAPA